jgi:PucR-like helix-turn-helix protein/diguanylate cyclase with GGDEF domain
MASGTKQGSLPHFTQQYRSAVCAGLASRREEIESSLLARIFAISEPPAGLDPEYLDGIRPAVRAAFDFALAVIELGERRAPPVPVVLLAQARLAARNGVGLDVVLRRYLAGGALVCTFVLEEVKGHPAISGSHLQQLLRTQEIVLDRLLTAVTADYARELEQGEPSSERDQARRIRRLLNGELLDLGGFDYDFEGHHVAAVIAGPGAMEVARKLCRVLDRRLLSVRQPDAIVWAWLGGAQPPDPALLDRLRVRTWSPHVAVALGEAAPGLDGWRLSHHQARTALPIALRWSGRLVRYAEVAILASMLQDDLLQRSLQRIYLAPLAAERDGGMAVRATIRAYLEAERNATSAAAALGVSRQTVVNRLQRLEGLLNRPLADCLDQVAAALQLDELLRSPHVSNQATTGALTCASYT